MKTRTLKGARHKIWAKKRMDRPGKGNSVERGWWKWNQLLSRARV